MIYFLRSEMTGNIKIGYTDMYSIRLNDLRKQHGALELLGVLDGDMMRERELHEQFAHLRIDRTEWFRPETVLSEYIGENAGALPTDKTVYVRVPMPQSIRKRLRLIALEQGVSLNEIVRMVMQTGLDTWGGAGRKEKSE